MSVKIYNSLTRKKEDFEPINPPNVNIYTCGVTVYDECHIGHARSLYIFDVMRRHLKYKGYKVNFVRNITDIDDKIINRANDLKISWKELVDKYIASYYEDLKILGIDKGTAEPRATENIPHMIKYIKGLIDKGYAYEAGGDVYFSVRKFTKYGKLSGQSIDQMETGVRINPTEHKEDPLDFALWKKSKEGEPSWPSPWGEGRPGWHIECSVMSQKFLKTDTLDIHAGGRDLIFPHHENEIAQAEALTGKAFAKYWIHHGLLTINEQKMAKSLGNFITAKNVLDKYPANVLKLFFLMGHYSQPLDFTWDILEDKKNALEKFRIFLDRVKSKKITKGQGGAVLKKTLTPKQLRDKIDEFKDYFVKKMDNDFDTPQAVACLFEIRRVCDKVLYDVKCTKEHLKELKYAAQVIRKLGAVLGLSFEGSNGSLTAEEQQYLDEYQKARSVKDYKTSDKKRTQLNKLGIIIEETKNGMTYRLLSFPRKRESRRG